MDNLKLTVGPVQKGDRVMIAEAQTQLAAPDITGVIVFFLITFVSWLIGYHNEKKKQRHLGTPPVKQRAEDRAPHRSPNNPVQDAVEQFLKDFQDEREAYSKKQSSSQDVVVVKPPRRSPPTQKPDGAIVKERPSSSQQSSPQRKGPQSREANSRQGQRQRTRSTEKKASQVQQSSTGQFGRLATESVFSANSKDSVFSPRVEEKRKDPDVQWANRNEQNPIFSSSLLRSTGHVGISQTLSKSNGPSQRIAASFHDVSQIRDAFLMTEVFGKPLALRKDSSR